MNQLKIRINDLNFIHLYFFLTLKLKKKMSTLLHAPYSVVLCYLFPLLLFTHEGHSGLITSHYPTQNPSQDSNNQNTPFYAMTTDGSFTQNCREMKIDEFTQLAQEIKEKHFPELLELDIRFRPHDVFEFLLKTNISPFSIFKSPKHRIYWIEYHPRLLTCAPENLDALRGILVHELFHIEDYSQKSSASLLMWLLKIFLNKKKFYQYERFTDERSVVKKSQGEQLILWRNYSNGMFTQPVLEIKKKRYLTIEEIEALMRNGN